MSDLKIKGSGKMNLKCYPYISVVFQFAIQQVKDQDI